MRVLLCSFVLGWLLLATASAQLTLPDLRIKAENRRLELVSLSMDVTVEGSIAETTLELEYYNDGRRNAEGEFSMELPEGATVSTYALEVNGEMRPGVSVEKAQARFAYESIKARNIDPGIVERQAGNVYRTRIFPIFPKKKKRVRIGFIHRIPDGVYQYKFPETEELEQFDLTIRGTTKRPSEFSMGESTFHISKKDNGKTREWKNTTLGGGLAIHSVIPEGDQLLSRFDLDKNGNLYFVAQGLVSEKEMKSQPLANWNEFNLIWDVSSSGSQRDHKAEFEAIGKILSETGDCRVNVSFLSEKLSGKKSFDLKAGAAGALIEYLKTANYFGVADFSKIPAGKGRTLIFSDGETLLPMFAPPPIEEGESRYLFYGLFDSVSSHFSGKLTGAYNLHHGSEIDFSKPDWNLAGWWGDLVENLSLSSETNLPRRLWNYSIAGNQFIVSGKVPAEDIAKAKFRTGAGHAILFAEQAKKANVNEWNFARRVWAERTLAGLERISTSNEIKRFSIAERLVSSFTSIIVLERFEDHLQYNIPPPEPDLLEKYHKMKDLEVRKARETLSSLWKQKKNWHQHPFPWFDFDFTDQIQKTKIWVAASHAGFTERSRHHEMVEKYSQWIETAEQAQKKRQVVDSAKAFKDWAREMDAQLATLHEISKTSPVVDRKQEIHVSVRGNVRTRGVFSGGKDYSLQRAVSDAGVPSYLFLEKVFLYRGGKRIGYNLLNPTLLPVSLRWGDMIVVESPPGYEGRTFLSGGGADPFAPADAFFFEEPRPRSRPGSGPARFEDPARRFEMIGSNRWDVTERNEFTSHSGGLSRNVTVKAKPRKPGFRKELESSADPLGFLLQDLKENGGLSQVDVIAVAKFFHTKGDKNLADQVLSLFLEIVPHPIEAVRSYAYWLWEFGMPDRSERILRDLLKNSDLDDRTKTLIHFDLAQLTDQAKELKEVIAGEPSQLSVIALTDFFNRGEKAIQEIEPYAMTSDYRVVITGMSQGFTAKVAVPERFEGILSDHSSRQVMVAGVFEHQSIKALPGVSKVRIHGASPGTYHIVIYRRFGNKNERIVKRETVYVEKPFQFDAGEIDFEWEDIDVEKFGDFRQYLPPAIERKEGDPF